MKFHKLLLTIVCASFFSEVAFSQNITNVDANQEGKAIAITYDLAEKSNISLYISNNNGKDKKLIPNEYLSGDIGKKVVPGEDRKILWKVLEQFPNQNFEGENLSFIVKGKIAMKTFVQVNGGYSIDSGCMVGITVGQLGQIGWYVKGNMTPSLRYKTEYTCNETGYVEETMPAYSGYCSTYKGYGLAGLSVRLGIPLYLHAGVGYGGRELYWETTNNNWVKNTSGSYSGLAIDGGLITTINSLVFSASVTMISSNIDFCIGLGYAF